MMNCVSVLLVNMHATALNMRPSALGKNFCTAFLSTCTAEEALLFQLLYQYATCRRLHASLHAGSEQAGRIAASQHVVWSADLAVRTHVLQWGIAAPLRRRQ